MNSLTSGSTRASISNFKSKILDINKISRDFENVFSLEKENSLYDLNKHYEL